MYLWLTYAFRYLLTVICKTHVLPAVSHVQLCIHNSGCSRAVWGQFWCEILDWGIYADRWLESKACVHHRTAFWEQLWVEKDGYICCQQGKVQLHLPVSWHTGFRGCSHRAFGGAGEGASERTDLFIIRNQFTEERLSREILSSLKSNHVCG